MGAVVKNEGLKGSGGGGQGSSGHHSGQAAREEEAASAARRRHRRRRGRGGACRRRATEVCDCVCVRVRAMLTEARRLCAQADKLAGGGRRPQARTFGHMGRASGQRALRCPALHNLFPPSDKRGVGQRSNACECQVAWWAVVGAQVNATKVTVESREALRQRLKDPPTFTSPARSPREELASARLDRPSALRQVQGSARSQHELSPFFILSCGTGAAAN